MKVGILGSGDVGKTLAAGFLKHGHEVTIGSRSPEKLAGWAAENPGAKTGTFEQTAAFGEILVLAVVGSGALDALKLSGAENVAGKTIVDATNPIGETTPINGVLPFFTNFDGSLMEALQKEFPDAHFVKAFNSTGAYTMVNPHYEEGRPTMFICGNDEGAKKTVTEILDAFGWDTEDMGAAEAARAIEPLCILWCIPGFVRGEWNHAFKLLKR